MIMVPTTGVVVPAAVATPNREELCKKELAKNNK
jgi:hypothetical protein